MTNTEMLQDKIQKSGLRITFIAKQIGLTYQGFRNKVLGLREFNVPEMKKLSDLLKLSAEEREDIFFANKVD